MTRSPHEWTSTDIALYSMGKMDMTDAGKVAAMRDANWTPAVQYWRQKHIEARAALDQLENTNAAHRAKSRATFDAMCAMRNSINELIPMPSLESDLLSGPESSVFCAAVAEAVAGGVRRFEAERDELLRAQDTLAGLVATLGEARAEIERLEKEVERLVFDNKAKAIQIEMHSGMAEDARQQRDTAWNDAIEAAAKMLNFDEACVDAHVKLWAKDRMEVVRALQRPTPSTEASHDNT